VHDSADDRAPVVAQLVRAGAATCWASTFDAAAIAVATADRFSAASRPVE